MNLRRLSAIMVKELRQLRRDRVTLAMRNARMSYRRRFRGASPHLEAVDSLRRHLGLEDAPNRIEGFDISTLQGGETVASLVVWEEGRMLKKDYRTFNMRGLPGQDDFESMRQAVERADALVASAIKRLAEIFANERSSLEEQWARGGDASTEDLRVALRRYRAFFDRLLSV